MSKVYKVLLDRVSRDYGVSRVLNRFLPKSDGYNPEYCLDRAIRNEKLDSLRVPWQAFDSNKPFGGNG